MSKEMKTKKNKIKAWAILENKKKIMENVSEWNQFEVYKTKKSAKQATCGGDYKIISCEITYKNDY